MALIKTIRKVGNGTALPLDKSLLDLMGLHVGDQMMVVVDGQRLILTPVRAGIGKRRADKIMKEIRAEYGGALTEPAK